MVVIGQTNIETTTLAAQQLNQMAKKQNNKGPKSQKKWHTCSYCG